MADKDAFFDQATSTGDANNHFDLSHRNFKPLEGAIRQEDPNSSLPHSIKYFNLEDSCAQLSQNYGASANIQSKIFTSEFQKM